MSKNIQGALAKKNFLQEDDTAVIFYDMDYLLERVELLKNLFPANTLHGIAVKANPLTKILKRIQKAGVGVEVATSPELYLAEKTGFSPSKIIYDSPAKTIQELEYALKLGVYINADSFEELNRIGEILKTKRSKSIIGVRVNPQVGSGTIKSTSVADEVSKFGIPLDDNKEKLESYFLRCSCLRGIHVHIGSQGCPVPLIIKGVKKVQIFTDRVNKVLENQDAKRQITHFDIGGGLAVSYHADKQPVSLETYVQMLKEKVPQLFSGKFILLTEFGRYLHANAGWVASKVEYVKKEKNVNIIMIHVGADLLLRKCYNPTDWHHQISVVDKNGKLKTGKSKLKYSVAGPLCFAGDIIAKNIELPLVETGDYILVHDAGAYTLSMWSRYNSRQIPMVIGYSQSTQKFQIIKKRETKDDLLRFWS